MGLGEGENPFGQIGFHYGNTVFSRNPHRLRKSVKLVLPGLHLHFRKICTGRGSLSQRPLLIQRALPVTPHHKQKDRPKAVCVLFRSGRSVQYCAVTIVEPFRQRRADSISASLAPLLRAHASAAPALYFAT